MAPICTPPNFEFGFAFAANAPNTASPRASSAAAGIPASASLPNSRLE
jgi:hypothetical protein